MAKRVLAVEPGQALMSGCQLAQSGTLPLCVEPRLQRPRRPVRNPGAWYETGASFWSGHAHRHVPCKVFCERRNANRRWRAFHKFMGGALLSACTGDAVYHLLDAQLLHHGSSLLVPGHALEAANAEHMPSTHNVFLHAQSQQVAQDSRRSKHNQTAMRVLAN